MNRCTRGNVLEHVDNSTYSDLMTQDIILSANDVSKVFSDAAIHTQVLKNINFHLRKGESVGIVGASGSGKSTLLHLLGGLDLPSTGQINLLAHNFTTLSDNQLSELRNRYLGFVYQFHHLLPEFTVLENVAIPLLIRNSTPDIAHKKAIELLSLVGLEHRLHHKIAEISGGEKQRTAIARALVNQPRCILADEPTGNLDPKTAHQVFDLLLNLNKEMHTSLIIVTHDLVLAKRLDRCLEMRDGELCTFG